MGAETLLTFAEESWEKLDAAAGERGEACLAQMTEATSELRELLPELVEMMIEGSLAVQERMAQVSAAVKGLVSKPSFEETNLGEIAERVVGLLRTSAQNKQVALELEAEEGLVAEVDRKQIYNAIYNLIFNALDACGAGTSVTFRLYGTPNGQGAVLECADTGPGMPPEIKAKLFTNDAVSTKPMGTGLGTKIVGDVVRAHSGEIELESELGEGTTIRCRLPLRR